MEIIRKASLNEVDSLQKICIDSYSSNFHDHWESGGLEWYLEKEFSFERLSNDLSNPTILYYFIENEGDIIGFTKINLVSNLPNLPNDEGVELEKIYILPEKKASGIGKKVIQFIINLTQEMNKKNLFLCVIDTNFSAISFYKKQGFIFHSKTKLDIPFFKEELKGMNRMYLEL